MSDSGVVNIHGKQYQTVAKRVNDFRATHSDYSIATEVISSGDLVCIKATISKMNLVLSTGYAEEVRDSSNINKTSALENCETSAVGRALAFMGYGGSEIASANEVNGAIVAGAKKEVADYFINYNGIVRGNMEHINCLLEAVDAEDHDLIMENWSKINDEDKWVIYGLAPTKGGILTTKARAAIKQNKEEFEREIRN